MKSVRVDLVQKLSLYSTQRSACWIKDIYAVVCPAIVEYAGHISQYNSGCLLYGDMLIKMLFSVRKLSLKKTQELNI